MGLRTLIRVFALLATATGALSDLGEVGLESYEADNI